MNYTDLIAQALEHGTPDCQHNWTVTSGCPLCLRGRIVRLCDAVLSQQREIERLRGLLRVEHRLRYLGSPWSCDTTECSYLGKPIPQSCGCFLEKVRTHDEAIDAAMAKEQK